MRFGGVEAGKTWKEYGVTFPSGTTNTKYTKCYINELTNEVFIEVYVTFPSGISGSGAEILLNLPVPLNSSLNVTLIDYFGVGQFSFTAGYMDYGTLRSRTALASGHTILGTIMYVAK